MKKSLLILLIVLCMLISCMSVFGLSVYAAPSEPILISPYNGQVLPWHDVILRWHQVSGEEYFLLDMRNISTGVSVYENLSISKDSTSVTIPKSKLVNGAHYRWFLRAVDADGNKTNADIRVFRIEYGRDSQGTDSHLWGTTYATASHIDYFISAPNSGLDSILQSAVSAWNGISSNVYLHRDYSDTTKELGIYENASTSSPDIWGRTYPGGSAYFSVGDDPYPDKTVTFTEIVIYYNNIANASGNNLYYKTMLHETGHALALAHTDGSDYGYSPYVPANNRIDIVDSTMDGVTTFPIYYLVMNNGTNISAEITDVDKAHLKIKWGE